VSEVTGSKQPDGAGEPIWWGSLPWRLHQVVKAGLDHFDRKLRAEGGTRATWSVLELLIAHGPMPQRDLARLLGIEGPTLTNQVDRLVRSGLLERRPEPNDRRIARVALTEDGRALYQRLAVVVKQTKDDVMRGLSPREMDQLMRLLDLLEANLR
jgi:MarR family transcriptional regulator for hemolysin